MKVDIVILQVLYRTSPFKVTNPYILENGSIDIENGANVRVNYE